MKKILLVAFIPVEIILLYLLNYYYNIYINNNVVQSYILPNMRNIDPNIASLIFNGLIDALVAFLLIVLLGFIIKRPLKELGFNLSNYKFSIRAALIFVAIFITIYIIIGTLTAKYNLPSISFPFPLNIKNYTAYLFFELFISGLEEIYFRCFVIMLILVLWRPIFKSQKNLEISAVIASTLIFVLRHIGITLVPFTITYLVPLQLLVAAVMGVYLGYFLIKSKSILGSYLAHGGSNFFISIFLLIINLILR
jgi:uncharacterized protein